MAFQKYLSSGLGLRININIYPNARHTCILRCK